MTMGRMSATEGEEHGGALLALAEPLEQRLHVRHRRGQDHLPHLMDQPGEVEELDPRLALVRLLAPIADSIEPIQVVRPVPILRKYRVPGAGSLGDLSYTQARP